jgi:quinoprotein relay system zinc metallohydrolase 2
VSHSSTHRLEIDRRSLIVGAGTALTLPFAPTLSARAAEALGLAEVASGAFVHKGCYEEFSPANAGDISNPAFVVGKYAIAVIDTGGSPVVGRALLAAIRGVSSLPIRYVINTHMHPDHVFGNVAFKGEWPVFLAHHKLPRALAARQERYLAINQENLGEAAFKGTEIIMPNEVVETTREIDLGGRSLVLEAQKTAHTDNDLTVRDTATDTLFLGDLLFAERIPSIDGSIRGWLAFLESQTAKPAARVVPGHGPPSMGWPDAARPLQRYLAKIAEDVRTMIKQGRTMTDAMANAAAAEKGAWALNEGYHARNVSAAFAELEWE